MEGMRTRCVGGGVFDGGRRGQRSDASGAAAAGRVGGAEPRRRLLDGGRVDRVLAPEKVGRRRRAARAVVGRRGRAGRTAAHGRTGGRRGAGRAAAAAARGARRRRRDGGVPRLAARRGASARFR